LERKRHWKYERFWERAREKTERKRETGRERHRLGEGMTERKILGKREGEGQTDRMRLRE